MDSRSMTTGEQLAKYIAVLAPVAAILGVGLPAYFGVYELSILGLYAAVPLLLAPYLYRLSLRESTRAHDGSHVFVTRKVLTIAFLVSLSVSLGTANAIPRPRVFFLGLGVCNTVALVYCLVHERRFVPLVFVSLSTAVFHLSSTVTRPLYLGSGDTPVVWLGVRNSIEQASLVPHAGYDFFPAFYSFIVVGNGILDVGSRVSMFLLGAGIMVSALWFVLLLSSSLPYFPPGYAAIPSVLLTFMYHFNYIGLYTIPQTAFGLLAVIPLAIIVGSLYGRTTISRRYAIVILVLFASLTWYHKIAHIWLLLTISLFLGVAITTKIVLEDQNEWTNLSHVRDTIRSVAHVSAVTLLTAFLIAFVYTFFHSNFPEIVIGYLIEFLRPSDVTGTGGGGFLVRDPVGMLFTFTGSSIILLFFLVGVFSAMVSNDSRLQAFTLVTLVLATVYFPGPIHVSEALGQLHLHRMTKLVFSFVAVVASIGVVKIWRFSDTPVRIFLILLVLSGGIFTLSNDMYTRDNPISETGTFTNYLTEHEVESMEFSVTHTDEIIVDVRSSDYMEMNHHLDAYERTGSAAEPLTVDSIAELCDHSLLVHESELDRRYAILFYHDVEIERSNDIPHRQSRAQVYDNGDDSIVHGGGEICT